MLKKYAASMAGKNVLLHKFYGHDQKKCGVNAFFSQWNMDAPFNMKINGRVMYFLCNEQAMMFVKATMFGSHDVAGKIMEKTHPRDHKALGRKSDFNQKIWDRNRERVVCAINYAKFAQNIMPRGVLQNTAGRLLVEASPYDRIYGIGMGAGNPLSDQISRWNGLNTLGFLETFVRCYMFWSKEDDHLVRIIGQHNFDDMEKGGWFDDNLNFQIYPQS